LDQVFRKRHKEQSAEQQEGGGSVDKLMSIRQKNWGLLMISYLKAL
jgi:hypothetical protein